MDLFGRPEITCVDLNPMCERIGMAAVSETRP